MNVFRFLGWVLAACFVLFLLSFAAFFLKGVIGVISLIGTGLGLLIQLIFSKSVLTVLAVALILYLIFNQRNGRRSRNRYCD